MFSPTAAIAVIFTVLAQTDAAPWPDDVFNPPTSRLTEGEASGKAQLEPSALAPAAVGDYTLILSVGAGGIASGGGIMVDFPKAWFTNPTPLVKPMQRDAPDGFHYIGVSAADASFDLQVDRKNFDNKHERFRHMITATLTEGTLRAGDEVRVWLGNTTAPYLAGEGEVGVAVDADGEGTFRRIRDGARYRVASGPATHVRLVAPSQAVVGQSQEFQITVFDRFDNVASHFEGTFRVHGLSDGAFDVSLTGGLQTFSWSPRAEGYYFPETECLGDSKLRFAGGPVRVYASEPATKIYWGDLHSHSRISKDGIGSEDFKYARDVAGLDFFASTEHDISDNGQDSITPEEWEFIQREVRRYYSPGEFVTFLAYECSLGGGHHNVFYRDMDGYPWPTHRLRNVETIWSKLQAGKALTIPHHLGIRWGRADVELTGPELQPILTDTRTDRRGGPVMDWTLRHDEVLRPVLEIYSKHGLSESFAPKDALAYEQVRYTGATSADGPHYAQDAWAAGHVVGTTAASDNHMAHPGLAHTGLTAVMAPVLTRDAIFDAILQRRTYATTGQRIIMDFRLGGAEMGRVGRGRGDVEGRVLVAAPSAMKYVEVLVHLPGETGWSVEERWEQPGKLLERRFTVSTGRAGAVVYVRAELEDEVGGRASRAWSSPIWLRPEE